MLTVTIEIREDQLHTMAETVVDCFFSMEYDARILDMTAFTQEDLVEDLMNWSQFQEFAREYIRYRGEDGFMNVEECLYEEFQNSRLWGDFAPKLGDCLDMLIPILRDAELQALVGGAPAAEPDDCSAAIETLRRAGFRVVRA